MIDKGPNTDAYLKQLSLVANLPGNVAECGVYRGQNTYHYADLLSRIAPDKILYAFDTFCGLPKDAIDDVDLTRFDEVDINDVIKLLQPFNNVCIKQGLFEHTFPSVSKEKFCCVVIDCDLRDSYTTTLNFFYPRLVPGGVFILDEYYSHKYPGARQSVDEFCKSVPEKPELFHVEQNGWQRWRIVKQ